MPSEVRNEKIPDAAYVNFKKAFNGNKIYL